MINLVIKGIEKFKEYIKEQRKKFIPDLIDIVDDVFHMEIQPDAKENAKGRILGQGGKGLLASHIRYKVKAISKNKVEASLYVSSKRVPYARIHEYGGTIKPKKKDGWLTIPFPGIKKSAREYKNTFFQESKAGNLILFQNLGKTKTGRQRRSKTLFDIKSRKGVKIRPLFSLHKEVEIPARPYLAPAIIKNIPGMRKAIIKHFGKWYR